jgi:hypothetical protein
LELTKWLDVIKNADQIEKDIQVLCTVAALIEKARFNINQIDNLAVFIQLDDTVSSLNMVHSFWAKCQVDDILKLLKEMNFQSGRLYLTYCS